MFIKHGNCTRYHIKPRQSGKGCFVHPHPLFLNGRSKRFISKPFAVIHLKIDIFLKIHLHAQPSGKSGVTVQTEHLPCVTAGIKFRSILPLGGTDETGSVFVVVGKSAYAGIVCLDSDKIFTDFQE